MCNVHVTYIYKSVINKNVKFTQYPLFQKLLELGGYLAKTSIEATHLVMGIGTAQRTVKFMCAISCCKYILTLQWILDSHAEAKFLRKYPFSLFCGS